MSLINDGFCISVIMLLIFCTYLDKEYQNIVFTDLLVISALIFGLIHLYHE